MRRSRTAGPFTPALLALVLAMPAPGCTPEAAAGDDGGERLDGGRATDAPAGLDASIGTDAGPPDASSVPDAPTPPEDAPSMPDAPIALDSGPPDAGPPDAPAMPDAPPTPDAGTPPTATYCVDIDVSNTCVMTVSPGEITIPADQIAYFCWRNRSRDYPVDVWLSYGGGYTDLAPGATWNEPPGHCLGPLAHDEYADISTACSSFRFLIHCL